MKRNKTLQKENFQAEYFTRQFQSWADVVRAYRLAGGHIPSHTSFNRAKLKIKKSANED